MTRCVVGWGFPPRPRASPALRLRRVWGPGPPSPQRWAWGRPGGWPGPAPTASSLPCLSQCAAKPRSFSVRAHVGHGGGAPGRGLPSGPRPSHSVTPGGRRLARTSPWTLPRPPREGTGVEHVRTGDGGRAGPRLCGEAQRGAQWVPGGRDWALPETGERGPGKTGGLRGRPRTPRQGRSLGPLEAAARWCVRRALRLSRSASGHRGARVPGESPGPPTGVGQGR